MSERQWVRLLFLNVLAAFTFGSWQNSAYAAMFMFIVLFFVILIYDAQIRTHL